MMDQLARERRTSMISTQWESDSRWEGVERPYTADDVVRMRGSVVLEHTLARI
jgi:isocitrate lyase